ncbi:uncharacterized protein LOC129766451 [Toxorhynchites rutilus septentrionalis]|uniref:uncharacterized protein LOC129766451 n=1 Tax=Toxorhynchites rutilus septentrionalis TaxID=329112 RepID=UPI00247A29DB|nr:uncharacterized protein LOC129766451 [Toxorhynchites rutilus septentrionalis]
MRNDTTKEEEIPVSHINRCSEDPATISTMSKQVRTTQQPKATISINTEGAGMNTVPMYQGPSQNKPSVVNSLQPSIISSGVATVAQTHVPQCQTTTRTVFPNHVNPSITNCPGSSSWIHPPQFEIRNSNNVPIASSFPACIPENHMSSQPTMAFSQQHCPSMLGPQLNQFQVASRQSMGRDLPTFTGNPEEWPVFIASFEQSTLACGFSNAENLIRLQRCLKGHALESTLRTLYGRPELLIRVLLEKVQQSPAPKPGRLETLVQFGLTVQNLVDHLAGANQKDHLSNPILMQQLVDKLPDHLKLNWVRYRELSQRFPHLRGLPLEDYELIQPKLLIGLDNLALGVPLKIRQGNRNDPIAAKCRLGWSIYGGSSHPGQASILNFHVGAVSDPDRELNEQLRDYFTLENTTGTISLEKLESEDDKRARKILRETTKRIAIGFETGLLWRTDDPVVPNSYSMAYRRLVSLERKLEKDPPLKQRIHAMIADYEGKGYAHKATSEELSLTNQNRVWYLPLGVVSNPKKPHKIRLIWDAAAKTEGVCFNSLLLKGPDLLTPLPQVLSQFRQFPVAVCGDIREMFHQIKIREPDRQSQRFLWRSTPIEPPTVYVMDVATFGFTCSPASAQYVKNLNASEAAQQFPRAAAAITLNHYVDDYLASFLSIKEAIAVVNEVKQVHAMDILPILAKDHVPTKREVLKVVMSLFDPLGLLAFFLIHGKILIQNTWLEGSGWDDPISNKLQKRWQWWTDLFPQLELLRIPLCYFPAPFPINSHELEVHIFVDASELAYSCVAYFRLLTENNIIVALISAKTKVAPIKSLSIPRLELKAAVLGTRLMESIKSQHTLPISRKVFWSDSSTVLAWIRSDHRRYNKFVSFRIGEILSSSEPNEWKWVPSKLNAADAATKWENGSEIKSDSRWFLGPSFLRLSEERWPKQKSVSITEEELRPVHTHWEREPIIDITRFSQWARLLRTMGYVLRFIHNLLHKKLKLPPESGVLTREEIRGAEEVLWKIAQSDEFFEETKLLKETQVPPHAVHCVVTKSSPIYRAWPFLDDRGVLRMRGRIGATKFASYEAKYQVILPRKHPITFLITDWYHRRFRHGNKESIVNEMRQRFEISKLRTLVKKVMARCVWCHVMKTKPKSPPMASLPDARVSTFVRPFTFVGLDYFGPVFVRVGRNQAKRWVALFTCLTIRAVHLEVVHTLSTESCIMAVKRFVARRGSPAVFYTDNATCFHCADKELQSQVDIRNRALASTFTSSQTSWKFIPPAAPHMGGAWERLVRSVKIAVGTIIDAPRKPDDETLETVLYDAEAMINSRPLTYIPLEDADQEALTPNHFLLGSSSGIKIEPVETGNRSILRSSWKLAQHITDEFWRRWVKEYLPVITRRCKWFEETKNIGVEDLVLVVNGTGRNQWIRGRVEQVFSGRDGRVRQAMIRTATGVLRRPVVKLAILDVEKVSKPNQESPGVRTITWVYERGYVTAKNPIPITLQPLYPVKIRFRNALFDRPQKPKQN